MDAETARKNWEIENNVTLVDPTQDQIYYYDAALDKETVAQKPWKQE
jgi:COP9 signalosome complex subunit 5